MTRLVLILLAAMQNFDANVAQLDWLAGHWRSEAAADGSWTEELWTGVEGETLLGVNRTVKGRHMTGFEFMRLANDEGGAAYFASPSGGTPVRFEMSWASHQTVTFTNPDHDYPQRIVYSRDGDRLTATISQMDGSRAQTWKFRLQPSR
jgi:hypothetical protein